MKSIRLKLNTFLIFLSRKDVSVLAKNTCKKTNKTVDCSKIKSKNNNYICIDKNTEESHLNEGSPYFHCERHLKLVLRRLW